MIRQEAINIATAYLEAHGMAHGGLKFAFFVPRSRSDPIPGGYDAWSVHFFDDDRAREQSPQPPLNDGQAIIVSVNPLTRVAKLVVIL